MAQSPNASAPSSPVLVAPVDGAPVDPDAVHFQWEDAGDDLEYALELAANSTFEDVLLTLDVGDALDVTVSDLPDQHGAYFWRMRSKPKDSETWGPYGEGAMFSVGEEPADVPSTDAYGKPGSAAPVRPDVQEDLGPVPGMLKGISTEVAAEVTGDSEYYAQEEELGVEHEAIGVSQILGFIGAIIAVLILIIIFVFQIVNISELRTYESAVLESGYPELRQVRVEAAREMTQYEILNDAEGIYQIPVDRAMELLVDQERSEPEGGYSPELPLEARN